MVINGSTAAVTVAAKRSAPSSQMNRKWKQQMFNLSLSLSEHTVAGPYRRRTGSAGNSQTMRLQHETFLNSGQNQRWKGSEGGLYKWLAPATIIRSSGGSCIIPLQPSAFWFPSSLLSPGVLMCRCLNQAELRGVWVPDVWKCDSLYSFGLFIFFLLWNNCVIDRLRAGRVHPESLQRDQSGRRRESAFYLHFFYEVC